MINKNIYLSVLVGVVGTFLGCATAGPAQAPDESREDVQEVLSAVAGAVSGKPLNDQELKELEQQIRTDEEAQSAIQSITNSMGTSRPVVKYCPLTGKRYAARLEICPEHQVELKIVGQ